MEPFLGFVISTLVPFGIERLKKWTSLPGDFILLVVCFLAGLMYLLYALIFGIIKPAQNHLATAALLAMAFWAGASGTYGLFYKHVIFKKNAGTDSNENNIELL